MATEVGGRARHQGVVASVVAPHLEGALCRGRHQLFDEPADGADSDEALRRRFEALTLCRRCPELGACREYVDALPARQRPTGVVAGRIHREPDHPKESNVRVERKQ